MRDLISVAAGGACGAMARHLVGLGAKRLLGAAFPWGTLTVNVLGALALGFLSQAILGGLGLEPRLRLALTTGFLGAFTTFSTFSVETLRLAEQGKWGLAVGNVALNLTFGLAAAFGGMVLARSLWGASGG